MTTSTNREIAVDLVPRFGTHAFKIIIGANREIISQTEFERLMAHGEQALLESDRALRKRRL